MMKFLLSFFALISAAYVVFILLTYGVLFGMVAAAFTLMVAAFAVGSIYIKTALGFMFVAFVLMALVVIFSVE